MPPMYFFERIYPPSGMPGFRAVLGILVLTLVPIDADPGANLRQATARGIVKNGLLIDF